MEAPAHASARMDLLRHRRVLGVVATLDLASLLLFIAFSDYGYDNAAEWFDDRVRNFSYLTSLFDVLALGVARFLFIIGYSADLPVLRYFFLPFFVSLCTVPYLAVKALFFGLESAGWQALSALGVGIGFAIIESYLLGAGVALHLR